MYPLEQFSKSILDYYHFPNIYYCIQAKSNVKQRLAFLTTGYWNLGTLWELWTYVVADYMLLKMQLQGISMS